MELDREAFYNVSLREMFGLGARACVYSVINPSTIFFFFRIGFVRVWLRRIGTYRGFRAVTTIIFFLLKKKLVRSDLRPLIIDMCDRAVFDCFIVPTVPKQRAGAISHVCRGEMKTNKLVLMKNKIIIAQCSMTKIKLFFIFIF